MDAAAPHAHGSDCSHGEDCAHASPSGARRHHSALLGFMGDSLLRRWLVWTPVGLLALFATGLSLLQCPVPGLTGCRCPGCGMTRSVAALARGDVQASLALHPFGGIFAVGWLLLVASELLGSRREALTRAVARVETRVPISSIVLGAFALFGIARLVSDAIAVLD